MTTTPNMGMVLPTDHDTTDTWGAVLNTALTLNDAHDHTAGKGVRITQAGISLTGDLSFAVHAVKDALALDMTPSSAASVAAYSSALFTNSADNNLYFRNSSGTNVQITAGSALNIAGVAGFGGDYASVGALADFIDANDTYHFYQQLGGGVRQYGKMAHADLDLFEYKANPTVGVPTNRVRQKSPASLAASYDVTWLTALPGATAPIQISSSGALTADPANAITLTNTVTATDLKHTSTWRAPIPLYGSLVGTNITADYQSARATGTGWTLVTGQIPVTVGDTLTSIITAVTGVSGQIYTFDLIRVRQNVAPAVVETWTDVMTGAYHTTTRTLTTPQVIGSGTTEEHWHIRCSAPSGQGATDVWYQANAGWTR